MTRLPDPRQLASIAQARARQTPADVQQMSSLMEKVGHAIDALPAQQVGWLADACEVASCSPQSREAFQSKLSETASKLNEPLMRLACCESGFHASMQPLQDFAEVAAQLGADQLGHLGSSLILSSQGIQVGRPSQPQIQPGTRKLQVSAECRFVLGKKEGSYSALSGVCDGLRAARWLAPTPLSVGASVDRSLCAEFQVLAHVCDSILEDCPVSERRHLPGTVWLFISAPPCLSCVAAMCQFHMLFPSAHFEVTWIADYSSGAAESAVKERDAAGNHLPTTYWWLIGNEGR